MINYLCNLYIPIIVVLFGALYVELDTWNEDLILRRVPGMCLWPFFDLGCSYCCFRFMTEINCINFCEQLIIEKVNVCLTELTLFFGIEMEDFYVFCCLFGIALLVISPWYMCSLGISFSNMYSFLFLFESPNVDHLTVKTCMMKIVCQRYMKVILPFCGVSVLFVKPSLISFPPCSICEAILNVPLPVILSY